MVGVALDTMKQLEAQLMMRNYEGFLEVTSGAPPERTEPHSARSPRRRQRHAGGATRKDFDLAYIATGDLLRHHVAQETELGKEASSYMDAGKLVPGPLVIQMILHKVEQEGDDGFLLDGFPRNVAQADALYEELEGSAGG